jgi:hypothetical protein
MVAAARLHERRLAEHGDVAEARRAVQAAAVRLVPDQAADLRAVLARPARVGAAGLVSRAFVVRDRAGLWVCPGVALLLYRGELGWAALLDTAGPLLWGEDRQLDPAGADDAFGRLQRLVTGCPSWDGPVGALVDELDWLADTARSVARERGAELDPGWACRVLAEVLERRTAGGWS